MRVLVVLMLWVAFAGCGNGCPGRAERARVQRIVLSLPKDLDQDADQREALRAAILAQLELDDLTDVVAEPSRATHVVKVHAGVRPGDDTNTPALLEGGPPDRYVAVTFAGIDAKEEYSANSFPKEVEHWVLRGFEDAWSIVTTARLLASGDDPDIVGALGSSDPRVRRIAMRLAGERKIEAAVEPLCKILEEEDDESTLLAAVGALIALGDARATPRLIELARNRPPRFVLQVVFAVGAIGGATARGYLVTLASGHPVEAVRRGAQDALAELERRREP